MLKNRRLLVVADGILQYLPFGALPAPGTNRSPDPSTDEQAKRIPLIAEHEIISLPSASALGVLRRQIQGRKPAEMSLAVLADPVFQHDDPRLASVATSPSVRKSSPRAASGEGTFRSADGSAVFPALRDGAAYPRLLFSGREGNDITSTVPTGSAVLWAGLEASREKATSNELSRYRFVHFATHGVIDDSHPNLSGIVLSMYDARGHEQDGFLRLHDIYSLDLPAELVVLSACNTGLGRDVRGEGFIGLVRGFMYAGAARVVASLWRVDDQSTAELMKRFYRGMLRENLSPAAALRAAQVEMSKYERWSAPYYWAGFVLQGEYK
jgi:CHAT domain-containing protein